MIHLGDFKTRLIEEGFFSEEDADDVCAYLRSMYCPCGNSARYDSGYCGTCDVRHNQGKGVRLLDNVVHK